MKILKLSDIYANPDLKKIQESDQYVILPFFKNGKALDSPARWGMTLKKAGSMRFRWNEENPLREKLLKQIAGQGQLESLVGQMGDQSYNLADKQTYSQGDSLADKQNQAQKKGLAEKQNLTQGDCLTDKQNQVQSNSLAEKQNLTQGENINHNRKISQVQLDHTKIVLYAENEKSTFNQIADGIVTQNKELLPVVTIADCMALFFYDPITKGAGIVHSGWKGTGIAAEAIKMMKEKFGSEEKNILVSISPCIHQCCYIITEDRARYFSENFGKDCVKELEEKSPEEMKIIRSWKGLDGKLFRLSLPRANYNLLTRNRIPEENICLFDECTCCNPAFGSNRRETAEGKNFTVQAAFVRL